MNNMEQYIEIGEYLGEGYSRVIEYDKWTVAAINRSDNFSQENFFSVSRHNETDETFVLTEGSASLIVGEIDKLFRVELEKFKFYNVKKGTWHALFVSNDAKVIVVENSNTGSANSDKYEDPGLKFTASSKSDDISAFLEQNTHDAPGYKRVVEFDSWTAALINYSEHFDEINFSQVERHNATDEVFILIDGQATLMVGEPDALVRVEMEKNKFYNIKKGAWHHVFLSKDAKVLIAENSDTGSENSDIYKF